MAVKYDASSIEVLMDDRDRVVKQPHLYIPDKRLAGCLHLVREIVDNAQDEIMQVGGSVEVTYNEKTREVTVADNGRGIPIERLKELCEVLNSSGKFSKGNESAYTSAGGLHGIGNKLANFLSDYFEITSTRDKKSVTRKYVDGYFKKEIVEKADPDQHGTFVKFRISDKYLKETDKLSCENIMHMVEEKADACPGFKIKFSGVTKEGKKIKEKFEGLTTEELFKKYCKSTSKTWFLDYQPKGSLTKCRIGFGYNSKAVTEENAIMGWCNYIYNKEGGTHVEAVSNALYEFFRKYLYKNFLSEKDKKNYQFRKEDVRLGLCGVVVLVTNEPEYLGQFKEKFTSVTIGEEIEEFITKQLNKMTDSDIRIIATILRDNIKARMSSIKARQQVKKVGNGLSKDAIEKFFPKRMGCTTSYTELYIVEGKELPRYRVTYN